MIDSLLGEAVAAAIDDALRRALAERYELIRVLGTGGMSVVYLARERKHDRYVAVKVLRADLADGPASVRFAQEIQLLSKLNHPSILSLIDSGEASGWRYFSMPLVTGESLRERLIREGPLRLGDAIGIATQVAAALEHAHAQGIVHRDVKPENILLAGSRALLADFGVARVMDPPAPASSEATTLQGGVTRDGQVVGTPAYMSPEQIAGDRPVDGRSDIYALAAVVYELLVGETPFTGPTPVQLMARHLSDQPRAPRHRLADVPASLDDAVLRGLAKDPADRFQTAGAFAAALTRNDLGPAAQAPRASASQVVAVLDFEDLSGDPDLGWLGTGIAETVAAELGRVAGLRAIPRDRLAKAAPNALGIADEEAVFAIGQTLGARWVVWGTYQRAGNAVRVIERVADVPSRVALAPEKTDGVLDDLFRLQDKVVGLVVTALAVHSGRATPAPREPRDPNALSAFEHSMRGLQHFRRFGPKGFAEAWEHYERAIALEPNNARALSGMGAICCFRFIGSGKREVLDLAQRLLDQAISLDPGLGEAHLWLGYAYLRQHRYDEAEVELRRATELDPGHDFAHYMLGARYQVAGVEQHRWELFARAIPSLVRSIELQPASIAPYLGLGFLYLLQGDPLRATGVLERAVALEARGQTGTVRVPGATTLLGCAHRRRGADHEAAECQHRAVEQYQADEHLYAPMFTGFSRCELGVLNERAGRVEEALGHYLAAAAVCEANRERLGTGGVLVQARLGLAGCYCRLGLSGEQHRAFDAALELFERHQGAAFDTAWASCDALNQYDFARYFAIAGEADQVIAALRTAVDWGWGDLPSLERDHAFDRLRERAEISAIIELVKGREPLPGYPPSLIGGPL